MVQFVQLGQVHFKVLSQHGYPFHRRATAVAPKDPSQSANSADGS